MTIPPQLRSGTTSRTTAIITLFTRSGPRSPAGRLTGYFPASRPENRASGNHFLHISVRECPRATRKADLITRDTKQTFHHIGDGILSFYQVGGFAPLAPALRAQARALSLRSGRLALRPGPPGGPPSCGVVGGLQGAGVPSRGRSGPRALRLAPSARRCGIGLNLTGRCWLRCSRAYGPPCGLPAAALGDSTKRGDGAQCNAGDQNLTGPCWLRCSRAYGPPCGLPAVALGKSKKRLAHGQSTNKKKSK